MILLPYCPNCGKETAPGATFCASCGRPLHGSVQAPMYVQPVYYSKKEEIVAVLLSFFIPGAGQMYAGRIVRGLIILLAPPIVFFFVFLPIFFQNFISTIINPATNPSTPPFQIVSATFGFVLFPVLAGLLWLGFVVWNVFDAYNLTRIYNQHLLSTGKPPW